MYLSLSELLALQILSCRRNFAANCAKRIFSKDERLESNVNSKSSKKKLDENKIKFIESVVFNLFPLNTNELKKKAWADCVRAIDESARYLKYSLLKKK